MLTSDEELDVDDVIFDMENGELNELESDVIDGPEVLLDSN